jgi:hypothetical protein
MRRFSWAKPAERPPTATTEAYLVSGKWGKELKRKGIAVGVMREPESE